MTTKSTHGGKRKKAGRKPASDPKIILTVYIETSKVKKHGGVEKCKEKIISLLS